jgi:hypothetical protein
MNGGLLRGMGYGRKRSFELFLAYSVCGLLRLVGWLLLIRWTGGDWDFSSVLTIILLADFSLPSLID